jgi:hypothetical protein
MALRFRKSVKLAPGIRWNLSRGGSSFSFGPRGASLTTGKRGTFLNAGLPGTGLSARSRVDAPAPRPAAAAAAGMTSVKLTCRVSDSGQLEFVDGAGNPVPEQWVEMAKKQNRDALTGLIQEACDEVNDEVQALARIHLSTPDPSDAPRFVPDPFDDPAPVLPAEIKPGLFAGLLASRREAIAATNRAAREAYKRDLEEWKQRRGEHEATQQREALLFKLAKSDPPAMEIYFEQRLRALEWPRETVVAFEVHDGGRRIALDVDLPEIEDMPSKAATVPARGLKLSVKDMTATQVQKLYLGHVHGVIFRLIGEAFAALPTVDTVTASGYSQRANPKTGNVDDDYVLSVRVAREQWRGLNFGNLAAVDPVEALGSLGAVRNIQRSGKLLTIEPLAG